MRRLIACLLLAAAGCGGDPKPAPQPDPQAQPDPGQNPGPKKQAPKMI
jgi:hypothetical protein